MFKEDGAASKTLERWEDAKFFVANTAANDHALRETVQRMKKLPKNVNPRITPIDTKRRDCESRVA